MKYTVIFVIIYINRDIVLHNRLRDLKILPSLLVHFMLYMVHDICYTLYIHTHIYIYTHIYMYTHIYTHIYICIYIYTHIYTYMHIRKIFTIFYISYFIVWWYITFFLSYYSSLYFSLLCYMFIILNSWIYTYSLSYLHIVYNNTCTFKWYYDCITSIHILWDWYT
jgi:hypothetical protein